MNDSSKIFSCTRCGFCCQGETTVSLDDHDLKRMANELKLSSQELEIRFLKRTGAVVQMKTIAGHCIFYNQGCTVHAGRPWRCAQWPLVPALLESEDNFIIIKDSCPGINSELSYQQFCELFKDYLENRSTAIC